MKKVNTRVMRAIRNSKGRFFGLYTSQGESVNAQLMGETENYVKVYDRNAGVDRKFAKTSICGVRLDQKNFGKTL
jgi:hypothetical protein|tara:strand:- start:1297 stop:1521 length:225 start_codon:yes stop_codon:yes gene_type:complete